MVDSLSTDDTRERPRWDSLCIDDTRERPWWIHYTRERPWWIHLVQTTHVSAHGGFT